MTLSEKNELAASASTRGARSSAEGRRSILQASLAGLAAGLAGASSASAHAQRQGRTFVLIHGAWFGGWVWKDVAAGLRAAGHTVYAPSLTGVGDRRHLLRPGINLDTHTDDVVSLIEMEDLDEIVLVGWSYGGMVIANVLARIPQKIGAMVYLDAFVPERGRSLASYGNRTGRQDELFQQALEGRDIPVSAMQVMGITDQAVIDHAMPRVGPQPIATFLQASKALEQRPNIPHAYVLAGGYPNPTFRPFHKMFRDQGLGETYVLNTSHATMLTDPKGTIDVLLKVR